MELAQFESLCEHVEHLKAWGASAEAMAVLEEGIRLARETREFLAYLSSWKAEILGKTEEALSLLAGENLSNSGPVIRAMRPDLGGGFLGLVLLRMGRPRQALPLLRKAWRKHRLRVFRKSLASTLIEGSSFLEAEQYLSGLHEPEVWMLRGLLFKAQRKLEHALDCLERALPFLRKDPRVHDALAEILQAQGRFQSALPHRFLLVSQLPDDCERRFQYGLCLGRAGLQPEALAEFQIVLEKQPNHRGALIERCRTLLKLGHYQTALRLLDCVKQESSEKILLQVAALERLRRGEEALELLGCIESPTPYTCFFEGVLRQLCRSRFREGPALLPPDLVPLLEERAPLPFSSN